MHSLLVFNLQILLFNVLKVIHLFGYLGKRFETRNKTGFYIFYRGRGWIPTYLTIYLETSEGGLSTTQRIT